jgi:hypothetical protein
MKAGGKQSLTNYALRHEGVWERGCIDPRFLEFSTSWRWVVSFTPRPLYPRGKSPWYPLGRRLDGSQNRSGWRGKRKFLTLPGLELWLLSHPAGSQLLYWMKEWIRGRPDWPLHRDLYRSIVHPPLFQPSNSPTLRMKCSILLIGASLYWLWYPSSYIIQYITSLRLVTINNYIIIYVTGYILWPT